MTISEYFDNVAEDKKAVTLQLFKTITDNIPVGFQAEMLYGMPSFVVPFSLYPNGYHCNTALPLPFISIAAQKNAVSFYHMGIYSDDVLKQWFESEYKKHCKTKLDMGKSCIRFKKTADKPFDLLGELTQKMTVQDWILCYEKHFIKKYR